MFEILHELLAHLILFATAFFAVRFTSSHDIPKSSYFLLDCPSPRHLRSAFPPDPLRVPLKGQAGDALTQFCFVKKLK